MPRFPDAVQHEVVHRSSGIASGSEFETIPGLQRITACCAAPGKHFYYSAGASSVTKRRCGARRSARLR